MLDSLPIVCELQPSVYGEQAVHVLLEQLLPNLFKSVDERHILHFLKMLMLQNLVVVSDCFCGALL